ncbi:Carboxyl-terminal protease [Pedobacter sp. BAL39]|uniref:S41 family peptidase n=1 Tax=Pedobacter sp. BAL39 TaxID=391596 RepID=UPI000155941F|nr:S41 family peptidase [Pedobacter sp. BAL39]EDM36144.1 Carboxyl-terminal protease [Pedobacter sp. BAL39]
MKSINRFVMLSLALSVTVSLTSCKKNKSTPDAENTTQTSTTDRVALTNDSLFLYAKEVYFWNESLPSYDAYNPRQFTKAGTDILNYETNLINIAKVSGSADYLSASNSTKYSYIEDIRDRNPAATGAVPLTRASVDLEGNGNDVGIYAISPVTEDNITYKLFILAVSQNSPADRNGLTRGAYITKINTTAIGGDFDRERTVINSTIYGDPNTLYLEGVRTDGSSFKVTLNKTSYKSSPIYKTNVLTVSGKTIGYVAYARFSNAENSEEELTNIFNDFKVKNVTDLIVDLRYNGGGYISTAEHLANLIAPEGTTGTMYVEHYNNKLKNRKSTDATILSHQPFTDANDVIQYENGKMLTFADIDYSVTGNTRPFKKVAGLTTVQNVVFIVSGGTASSSEMLINSLKPKMNVKLVGEQTYGKPVGFFPIRIENRYDVLYAMFEVKNSLGEGNYYSGFTPDVDAGYDYGDFDFGNPSDEYLAAAIKVLAPGSRATGVVSKNALMSISGIKSKAASSKVLEGVSEDRSFKGMIETRHNIRN